jgi:hypothetical protein
MEGHAGTAARHREILTMRVSEGVARLMQLPRKHWHPDYRLFVPNDLLRPCVLLRS